MDERDLATRQRDDETATAVLERNVVQRTVIFMKKRIYMPTGQGMHPPRSLSARPSFSRCCGSWIDMRRAGAGCSAVTSLRELVGCADAGYEGKES